MEEVERVRRLRAIQIGKRSASPVLANAPSFQGSTAPSKSDQGPPNLDCGGRTKWRRRFGEAQLLPMGKVRGFEEIKGNLETWETLQSGVAALALPPQSPQGVFDENHHGWVFT